MKVYDLICSLEGTEYLLGTVFDEDFANFVCSISSQVYAEYNLKYEDRDLSEAPRVLEIPELENPFEV